MNTMKWRPILIVVVIGVILACWILMLDQPATSLESAQDPLTHAGEDGQVVAGPRGGKLFSEGDFSLELTIFEKGVPPQFRIYTYYKGKPLPSKMTQVAVTLTRLGGSAQLFRFTPEADYLLGDQVVDEPHSFDIAIAAEYEGKLMRWSDSQVEGRAEIPDAMLKSMGIELLTVEPAVIKP